MTELTDAIALRALDGLLLRSQIIAHNLANAASPSFQPFRVSFEDSLVAAAGVGVDAVEGVESDVELRPSAGLSPGVRIDLELAEAAQTAGRYRAIIAMLNADHGIYRAATGSGGI